MIRAPSTRHAQGFSLLEAIVAMVVMASTLLVLYGWLSSSTLALTRVQAQSRALEDARSALAIMETVNPMLDPRGQRTIGPISVAWQATPAFARRSGISRAGMPTLFDFTLFDVDVKVTREGRLVKQFRLRRAGWEAVRDLSGEAD
ncbi:PulJ/GspJ family protein [Aerolutibacter ruishenii]|uniref:General secretion pathway protein I n=1 Tax=Aerolutibacter ruishenii TaxID=686800 RepID=A0A562M346_9GAMM|nr:prepilin-type N-terminal cleavage/methylation domain-containing protein [Lysobacter ruishenii]TWI14273.1 general secretion pathway protein I [Lysobacter ruishenii]